MMAERRVRVGEWEFVGELPATRTDRGPEFAGDVVVAFERQVALYIAEHALMAPETLRFLRQIAGLKQDELAKLLDTNGETVSRWEKGRSAFDVGTWYTVAAMAAERVLGLERTIERLRQRGKTPAGEIKLAG